MSLRGSRRVRSGVAALVVAGLAAVMSPLPATAARPPKLAAHAPVPPGHVIASINQTLGDQGHTNHSTRSAGVEGDVARGLSVSWEGYSVEFDADAEHPLHEGVFTDVTNSWPNSPYNLEVYGDRDFPLQRGEFDVLDLATDADGHFTRFDIVYITSTISPVDVAFGEVRLNEPEAVASLSPSALSLRWPVVRPHSTPIYAQETLTNTGSGPLKLGQATVGHGATKDFTIREDRCSGRTLPAAGTCTLGIDYVATRGGPRVATLTVPAGRSQLSVALAGVAVLGTTQVSVSGPYAPEGRPTTYTNVWLNPYYGSIDDPTSTTSGYEWNNYPEADKDPHGLSLDVAGPRPLPTGVHRTSSAGPYTFTLLLDYSCGDRHDGTITVDALRTDRHNLPTYARIAFDEHCDGTSYKGTLLWQYRHDLHAPTLPTQLKVASGRASWVHSHSSDYGSTIVRVLPAHQLADASPITGYPVASSAEATSARLPTLTKGKAYTLLAYSIDKNGNASTPSTLSFTG